MIGVYDNPNRARQLLMFDGMTQGNKCFTDFDAVMEYDNKAWLLFEVKMGDKTVPTGQRLALERFVDDVSCAGKDAVAVILEHRVMNPFEDVLLRMCKVRSVYMSGEFRWRPPKRPMNAREFMNDFVRYVRSKH